MNYVPKGSLREIMNYEKSRILFDWLEIGDLQV